MMLLQITLCGAQKITPGSIAVLPGISISASDTAGGQYSAGSDTQRSPQRILSSTERALGYVSGDEISTRGVYVGEAGTYNVGAIVTPQTLSDYSGCKIVGMRFALSQSIGKTTAFIYKINNNVASSLVDYSVRRTAEGWNEVRFNTAQEYTITGDEQLLFGFAYNETEDMAAAKSGALCFYTPQGTNSNASLIEKDGAFYSIESLGNLCVQLIVDVSSLPNKAVSLRNIMTGNKYHKAGEQINGFAMYYNTGLDPISSVRIGCRIDDGEALYVDKAENVAAGASGSIENVFSLPQDIASGAHKITFFVDQIDGEAPAAEASSSISDDIMVYSQTLPRQKHYVEQYNSQQSYTASLVNESMSSAGATGKNCLVNVYRTGEPLNVSSSDYLYDLYAYAYPCFTIDRFYFMGEASIAFDVNDYAQIMPDLAGQSVDMLAKEADANPSFASIDLKPVYDEATRTVTVAVSGDVVEEYPAVLGELGITLMLTEDNVKSGQVIVVNNKAVTTADYYHNQVLRTYLTAPTGDNMQIEGGKYSATYTCTLPDGWKPDDINVVALASRYFTSVTDDNILDADITNATSAKLTTTASGISSAVAVSSDNSSDGVYTVDGVKVGNGKLAKGMFIVRKDGKTRKIMIK